MNMSFAKTAFMMMLMVSVVFAFDIDSLLGGAETSLENTGNTVEAQGIDVTTVVMLFVAAIIIIMYFEKMKLIMLLAVVYIILQWRGVL